MSRVMGAILCHYGAEYLPYAIKSMYNHVEEIYIYYVKQPSFGRLTAIPCPESEEMLREASLKLGDPDNKIRWVSGGYGNEGQHRTAYETLAAAKGYEIVVITDTDEIWDDQSLAEGIEFVRQSTAQRYRVPMIHFWQDYDMICRDPAQPHRFYKVGGVGEAFVHLKKPMWHFGYAIEDELMVYKWAIHGHHSELRPDWMETKWFARATKDVHPTCLYDFWTPEPYDKEQLPDYMKNSPRWAKKRL